MFVLIGGVLVSGICCLCCNLLDKDVEKFGFIPNVSSLSIVDQILAVDVSSLGGSAAFDKIEKLRKSWYRRGLYCVLNFVPIVNIMKMFAYLVLTTLILKSDISFREQLYHFFSSSIHFSSLKNISSGQLDPSFSDEDLMVVL